MIGKIKLKDHSQEFVNDMIKKNSEIVMIQKSNWKCSAIEPYLFNKYKAFNNIYFLSGWDHSDKLQHWHRWKDSNIKSKNYFAIDLDIRNAFLKQGKSSMLSVSDISNEQIIELWIELWQKLQQSNSNFWWYKYIVFTWNWLHIYYKWTDRHIDPKTFALWVESIFKQWDTFIDNNLLESDHACKNIGRIYRLPWSVNQKNKAPVICIDINRDTNNNKLFNSIEEESKKEIIRLKERQKVFQLKQLERGKRNLDNSLLKAILEYPAYKIAEYIMTQKWFNFPFDWRRNFKNNKWWVTWYFYNKDTNSICNGWSQYFVYDWSVSSCWSNFSIIKNEFWLSNSDTYKWFEVNLFLNQH